MSLEEFVARNLVTVMQEESDFERELAKQIDGKLKTESVFPIENEEVTTEEGVK